MDVSRTKGTACWSVVQTESCSTQQFGVPDRELIPGQKLPATHRAAKTFDVINTVSSSHHQIVAAKPQIAFCAFYTEQSVRCKEEIILRQHWIFLVLVKSRGYKYNSYTTSKTKYIARCIFIEQLSILHA